MWSDFWVFVELKMSNCSIIAELMVLGFISLLLTFSQYYIAKICIPTKVADTMLPCPVTEKSETDDRRRLLWYEHRMLAGAYSSSCNGVIYLFKMLN